VWIMPIYRIADQLPVSENMFDVVIVDEASQAGLEATFLQYLAPRIVVIGDDKQVSPSAVGVDQQELRDLAGQYLHDNRYIASWQDPKVSLFDIASVWFGARTTLVEHRRCVPEIIGFSDRIAYEPDGIKLLPVRQFGSDRLDPVVPVHVPEGYEKGSSGSKVNEPEAEAIVAQIEKCLADPRYEDKTIGVISLLGPLQAKRINSLLLERVTPETWAAHDLRCGDATAFQGSERDVMFLSMVCAPEPGKRMGASTAEANVQRYNVAASRAKDQMWVFHTVQLDQLANHDDMRFALLHYCYHGVQGLRVDATGQVAGLVPEDRRVEPFESLFEQRVHNRIVERGYTVVPQFDSIGYRIDLVVVGARNRLAVECDGDHWHGPEQYSRDLARERDLRRCGWEFFRLRESAFYVDTSASLSELWTMLEELRIRPADRPGSAGRTGEEPAAVVVSPAATPTNTEPAQRCGDFPREVEIPVPGEGSRG
jgi:very-short-patch-repair endonuclease